MGEETGKEQEQQLIDLLASRAVMKQDVHLRSKEAFSILRTQLGALISELADAVAYDERVRVEFAEVGDFAARAIVAGDTVVFTMHTNVFRLDQSQSLWKTSYLQEDDDRGYFGVINVYNFLSDSFRYNRESDLGYLVARIFVNKEGHFFVQGKKQLSFLYTDPAEQPVTDADMRSLLMAIIKHVLQFDLLAPPYDQVDQVTVAAMKRVEGNSMVRTGKRLGFRFQADEGGEIV